MAGEVDAAVAAIRTGGTVLLPTDTVYGLCADLYRGDPARRLNTLKGRDEQQPVALLAADVDHLFECVPELQGRDAAIARALMPGPYTLILTNPARRFKWLSGRTDTIGVRVGILPAPTQAVLDVVGAVAATSANVHGGPDPLALDDVPAEIREACAAVIDGGVLPGRPSTILDLTGDEPVVVRVGAGDPTAALEIIRSL